jgi:hypothetical protein
MMACSWSSTTCCASLLWKQTLRGLVTGCDSFQQRMRVALARIHLAAKSAEVFAQPLHVVFVNLQLGRRHTQIFGVAKKLQNVAALHD